MSKKCPRGSKGSPEAIRLVPDATSLWLRRVFRNSYTYRGRRIAVRRWSVKIQYRGVRHTFSLAAKNRAKAATEAQAIHRTIVAQGWDSVWPHRASVADPSPFYSNDHRSTVTKSDIRYWKGRLLRRGRPSARPGVDVEWSARIEHEGISHYFPLGVDDQSMGAEKAREIFLNVVNKGWESARRTYRRELTLALHWAENPVAWTYATIYTIIGDQALGLAPVANEKPGSIQVIVAEPDSSARAALLSCVNLQTGFECRRAVAALPDVLREVAGSLPYLVLVNRSLFDERDDVAWEKLRRAAPKVSLLFYTFYEDSDQLFKATPGGASGYLLKRTSPDRLLEPIAEASHDKNLSKQRIATYVRQYFQNVIQPLSNIDSSPGTTLLTHREQEIMNLLSKGYSDKEMADRLGISGWTVHGHLKRIFEKLGVHTRTEAAIKYLQK